MSLIDGLKALEERGFIKQCTDLEGLYKYAETTPLVFYAGFDPTGPSLHAGHMVPLFAMAHLQKAGHKALALVGGATARIGDPSGKTEMRKMLTVETIKDNALKLKAQISKFIDFENGKSQLLDNADWLAGLNYIEFLRDIGKHFSVNRMLSFETYKMRLETGLSFIEFNYQLLQSYDFLVLNREYGCVLQIGGDDQWGNIVSGADLIRRMDSRDVFGLTFPLVTRADGKKMGKTEKGALFLDPSMVSPYEFFQYWRNVPDEDVDKFLKLYTFMPLDEIKEYSSLKDSGINRAKEKLAWEITAIVHGREEADKAKASASALFTGADSGLEAVPTSEIDKAVLAAGITASDLFSMTGLCSSKSDARRLIDQGGASVNGMKVTSMEQLFSDSDCNSDGQLILKAGKKRYYRLQAR
jgi:tyrosyl-tRNA synthetase